ncbi:MAG: HAD family hydrolase [Ktedonobacterales bacterium]
MSKFARSETGDGMKRWALLFDMDETLLADAEGSREALVATAVTAQTQYEAVAPDKLVGAAWDAATSRWRRSPATEYCERIGISAHEGLWGRFTGDDPALRQLAAWAPGYQRGVWSDALAACGIADDEALAPELALRFRDERRKRHWLFDDVAAGLDALRRDHRLALVTNGVPDIQRDKLISAGLDRWMEVIVVSGELGIGKPDARIFAHTLHLLDADPANTVMIGDSLSRDIAGAHAAGLRAIWIRRDPALAADPAITPDATITTLAELPALLRVWGG